MFVPTVGLSWRGLLTLLALVGLAGCGPPNQVGIQYNGFSIQPSTSTARPGPVVFHISNQNGQVTHQLLVVATDTPADQLRPGADSRVDEGGLKIMARGESVDIGQSTTLTAFLPPGHYVLLCNIVGHYQLGMHADFTVAP